MTTVTAQTRLVKGTSLYGDGPVWYLEGVTLGVGRDDDGTKAWQLEPNCETAHDWLESAGLLHSRFRVRRDAVIAVAAEHAACPIPAGMFVGGAAPALRKVRAGLYRSEDGRYEISRSDRDRCWELADLRDPGAAWALMPTVAYAQHVLDYLHVLEFERGDRRFSRRRAR